MIFLSKWVICRFHDVPCRAGHAEVWCLGVCVCAFLGTKYVSGWSVWECFEMRSSRVSLLLLLLLLLLWLFLLLSSLSLLLLLCYCLCLVWGCLRDEMREMRSLQVWIFYRYIRSIKFLCFTHIHVYLHMIYIYTIPLHTHWLDVHLL